MSAREVTLATLLKPGEVADALNRRSDMRGAKARNVAALFEGGQISSEDFELRLIGQRGHAPAVLRGKIAHSDVGSTLTVRISSSDPFGVIWSAGCLLGAFVALLNIRSWSQAPAALGVATGAVALLALHRFLSRRAFEVGASTAELALKDALSARVVIDGGGR